MSKVKAVAVLKSADGIDGVITFEQDVKGGPTTIKGTIKNVKPGLHGFHIHQFGDLSDGCTSAGAHFNPFGKTHGAPGDEERHVGDLGNVESKGVDAPVTIDITDKLISLIGANSVIGRALVLHADPDDLGKTDHPQSKTTGNAGGRIACGVIGIAQ
jgi:Cu-Zn family superoxide dismutase